MADARETLKLRFNETDVDWSTVQANDLSLSQNIFTYETEAEGGQFFDYNFDYCGDVVNPETCTTDSVNHTTLAPNERLACANLLPIMIQGDPDMLEAMAEAAENTPDQNIEAMLDGDPNTRDWCTFVYQVQSAAFLTIGASVGPEYNRMLSDGNTFSEIALVDPITLADREMWETCVQANGYSYDEDGTAQFNAFPPEKNAE